MAKARRGKGGRFLKKSGGSSSRKRRRRGRRRNPSGTQAVVVNPPAAGKRKRKRKAAAAAPTKRRPWNKGKRLTHRKPIGGYKRKGTVSAHSRRVNPRRYKRRRNPDVGKVAANVVGAILGGVVGIGGSMLLERITSLSPNVVTALQIGGGLIGGVGLAFVPVTGAALAGVAFGTAMSVPAGARVVQKLLPASAPPSTPGGGAAMPVLMPTAILKLSQGAGGMGAVELAMGSARYMETEDGMGAIVMADDDDMGAVEAITAEQEEAEDDDDDEEDIDDEG